ncbi:MAG: protein-glutamate O-methyltransferase CheR [Acidobacteriota bacterium]|nr:protein-glutamate O-methyltransferase CheR [Acidobacteriota bacterium]
MQLSTVQSEEKPYVPSESIFQAVLHPEDFAQISQIVYKYSGIRLTHGKEELVRSRLIKRLRMLGLAGFDSYLQFIRDDRTSQELHTMIDALTTNKTSFFRENQHFDFMRTRIIPELRARGPKVRIWSAGCSSGEEPYTIAMTLYEEWPQISQADVRILATDISSRILAKARSAEYEKEYLKDIPSEYLSKYFTLLGTAPTRTYGIQDKIKKMIRFAQLNLMDTWPMKGPFDIIFCRNVMIYFDSATQGRLVRRFYDLLVPGGYLLVGHSESLVANSCGFKYVQPATYAKEIRR